MRQKQLEIPWPFLLALVASASLLAGCGNKLYVIGDGGNWTLETVPIAFTGESKMGRIGADSYRYFRYPSPEAAMLDVEKISEDGLTIGKARYEWGKPVHFFRRSKRIVIYVGDNGETVGEIEKVFGKEFAGSGV